MPAASQAWISVSDGSTSTTRPSMSILRRSLMPFLRSSAVSIARPRSSAIRRRHARGAHAAVRMSRSSHARASGVASGRSAQPNASGPGPSRRRSASRAEPLVERRPVARRHPPHHEVHLAQDLEPLAPALIEADVQGVPDEPLQRADVLPDGQVRDEPRVALELGLGVAGARLARALHDPDEARHPLAEPVHPIQRRHELGHPRVVRRRDQATDVQLRRGCGAGAAGSSDDQRRAGCLDWMRPLPRPGDPANSAGHSTWPCRHAARRMHP